MSLLFKDVAKDESTVREGVDGCLLFQECRQMSPLFQEVAIDESIVLRGGDR